VLTFIKIYGNLFLLKGGEVMDSIFGILFNLFEGLDLEKVLSSVEGSMIEYNVSVALDTFTSFFGGLFS
jgi:hypothetical protein